MTHRSKSTISLSTQNLNNTNLDSDIQNRMIQQFSEQSGMNLKYSTL